MRNEVLLLEEKKKKTHHHRQQNCSEEDDTDHLDCACLMFKNATWSNINHSNWEVELQCLQEPNS